MVLPKRYPPRTPGEIQAINTFKALLDPHQVIAHIEELTTVPDIDGQLTVLNDKLAPIAKLDVQVKKLPDNYGSSPKLQIDVSIFGYASITTSNPVLLIGVDIHEKKAYWYHVPMNVNPPSGQETVMIRFPLTQVIDGTDTRYAAEWFAMSQEHHRKLIEYDKLVETLAQLSKRSTLTTASVSSPGFPKIHEFLDALNSLLDEPFAVVKRRFYPGCWKVGLAYRDYSTTSVTYVLYPIRPEENQAQIKTIDTAQNLLSIRGLRGYFDENPISDRPKQHAIEVIERSMKQILNGKLLDHKGSEVLAREFMFAITDRFGEQMGLEKKDTYALTEIENAFYGHLPIWVHEAVELMVRENRNGVKSPIDCLYRKPYFNPEMLRSQITPEEMKVLDERVMTRLERHDQIPKIPIGSERIPLGFFEEYHSFLASNGVTTIHRLYKPRDYARAAQHGGHISELYSTDDLERNLKIFFDNLVPTYSAILNQNFPLLKDNLPLFHGATRVVVVLDKSPTALHGGDWPITIYNLKLASESSTRIDLCEKSECEDLVTKLELGRSRKSVELDNRIYEYTDFPERSQGLDFIYADLPMFGFIYEELQSDFNSYFQKSKEPQQ